ncbi:MAG TPA: hypothetical protein VLK85_10605 [Ramlibacter sp.]|nr:hypothetical protein [Ramlibacter sp.]
MYAVVAIHHPASERFDDALRALQKILDSIQGSPGLQGGYVGQDAARSQAMAVTLWEAKEQFQAVFPRIQAGVNACGIHQWAVQPARALKFRLEAD